MLPAGPSRRLHVHPIAKASGHTEGRDSLEAAGFLGYFDSAKKAGAEHGKTSLCYACALLFLCMQLLSEWAAAELRVSPAPPALQFRSALTRVSEQHLVAPPSEKTLHSLWCLSSRVLLSGQNAQFRSLQLRPPTQEALYSPPPGPFQPSTLNPKQGPRARNPDPPALNPKP